jgi:hypothetical protein
MEVGFIALMDVLGFSALVSGNGEDQRLQRYMQCLQKALVVEADNPEVDYVVFSDSIVLTTREHSAADPWSLALEKIIDGHLT